MSKFDDGCSVPATCHLEERSDEESQTDSHNESVSFPMPRQPKIPTAANAAWG